MIIDAFPFYNEFDMLECRLEYLYNHVDKFILSECNLTHAGNPKPFYFKENVNRYKKYLDKILYAPLVIKDGEYDFTKKITECDFSTDYFTMDRRQRSNISIQLDIYPDDATVIVGDLDEIPNIEIFPIIQKELESTLAVSLLQQSFYYNLKYRHPNFRWPYPAAAKKKDVMARSATGIREIALGIKNIDNAGWHCSYFMSTSMIQNKIKNFAHQEFNHDKWTNEQNIIDCMNRKMDPLGRMQLEHVHQFEFPSHFLNTFKRFYPET